MLKLVEYYNSFFIIFLKLDNQKPLLHQKDFRGIKDRILNVFKYFLIAYSNY